MSEGQTSLRRACNSCQRGGTPGLRDTTRTKRHQVPSVVTSAWRIRRPKSSKTRKTSTPRPVASGQLMRTSRERAWSSPGMDLRLGRERREGVVGSLVDCNLFNQKSKTVFAPTCLMTTASSLSRDISRGYVALRNKQSLLLS